jgi:uncharacterized glyoxalase superfamily protein PhnB
MPVLQVGDLERAVRFYESLGFRAALREEGDEGGHCILRWGGVELMLATGAHLGPGPAFSGTLYFNGPGVQELYARVKDLGTLVWPLTVMDYGTREFGLRDPDGYVIAFAERLELERDRALLRRAYAAFNARDLDGLLSALHPDVQWANGMEGGHVQGHAAARAYWERQWQQLDPRVDPLRIGEDEEGRLVVDVHQVVRDAKGALLLDRIVQHAYTVEGGLVRRMDILG